MKRVRTAALPLLLLAVAAAHARDQVRLPDPWPPRLNEPYPAVGLMNHRGEPVSLDSFRGKVVLIETIGMPCRACIAFAGGNNPKIGRFEGVAPQNELPSVEEAVRLYSRGAELSDPRLVYVQLLLYNLEMKSPTSDDARRWALHFNARKRVKPLVLVPRESLVHGITKTMVPGFHLLDKRGILRQDATGPRQSAFWDQLLPALPALLRQ